MEKNKVQELVDLTNNFCEQVKNLMKGEKDCGIILALHMEHPHDTDGTKQHEIDINSACGSGGDIMVAIDRLNRQTNLITKYEKAVVSFMLEDMLDKNKKDSGDSSPSDSKPDEQ